MEEHVLDLIPAYALGCLDEPDLLQVARHLPRCPACRAALEAHAGTVDQLALSVPLVEPPAELRQRVLARVEQRAREDQRDLGERQVNARPHPAAAQDARKAAGRGLTGWLETLLPAPRLSRAAWAAALLLLAALAVNNLLLWSEINALQTRLPAGNVRIVNLVGTPDAPDALGYLMIFPNEPYGTLVVEDVPLLEEGYQYQLWLIRDGRRTSGGVFSVDENGYGTLQIQSDQPLHSYPSFGVTVEPAGGSEGPTGQKVLGGDL